MVFSVWTRVQGEPHVGTVNNPTGSPRRPICETGLRPAEPVGYCLRWSVVEDPRIRMYCELCTQEVP